MDKPISVGDLVVVVKFHCHDMYIGNVFKVAAIEQMTCRCGGCGNAVKDLFATPDNDLAFPLSYLKRIPPIEELESEKRDEEITA